jgi:hypothetical protein
MVLAMVGGETLGYVVVGRGHAPGKVAGEIGGHVACKRLTRDGVVLLGEPLSISPPHLAPCALLLWGVLAGMLNFILGQRHTLNPFLVFLSIALWSWMWGPMGAFLATPLLISATVLQRHLSSNSAIGAS